MAQIRIEEDKKTNFLPWLLGLLLLGVIAWAAFAFLDDEDNDGALLDAEEKNAPVAEMATEISGQPDGTYTSLDENKDYDDAGMVRFMDYTADMNGKMSLDHEFSHNALTYLSDAVEDIANTYDVDITDNTARAKQLADEITKDPYATDHAEKIRMAAINITETLENINNSTDGNAAMQLSDLRKEAQAINGDTLTLEQKGDVRGFFGAARKVLNAMK